MHISLKLPEDLSTRLQNIVERTGHSQAFYMIEAIKEHIGDLEDLYLAKKRLENLFPDSTKTISQQS